MLSYNASLTQLTHNVVTTLWFGCSTNVPFYNVVKTLSQRCDETDQSVFTVNAIFKVNKHLQTHANVFFVRTRHGLSFRLVRCEIPSEDERCDNVVTTLFK